MASRARRTTRGLGFVLAALAFAPAPANEPPIKPPQVVEAARARLEAALKAYEESWVFYKQARVDVFAVFAFSNFALEAQADLAQTKEEYIAALEAHRGRLRELDQLLKRVRRVGFAQSLDVAATDYYLKDADYRIMRAKAEK